MYIMYVSVYEYVHIIYIYNIYIYIYIQWSNTSPFQRQWKIRPGDHRRCGCSGAWLCGVKERLPEPIGCRAAGARGFLQPKQMGTQVGYLQIEVQVFKCIYFYKYINLYACKCIYIYTYAYMCRFVYIYRCI